MVNYNSGAATYAYDGSGQRTAKTVGATTSHFVYDNAEGLSQLLDDGTNSYIYDPSGLPVEQINGTTVTYVHHDQLGSTRVLTNSARAVVGTYSYDPYGKATHTGTATTPLQYAGQYADAESGLIQMRARYYDPNTGSFMTVDPMSESTRSPYGYAADQPVNTSDPSGLNTLGFCGGGAVQAVVGGSGEACLTRTVGTGNDQIGSVETLGLGAGPGGGGSLSVGVQISNADSLQDLSKGFIFENVSLDIGVGVTAQVFFGTGSHGQFIYGLELGVGVGVSGGGMIGYSYSWVQQFHNLEAWAAKGVWDALEAAFSPAAGINELLSAALDAINGRSTATSSPSC